MTRRSFPEARAAENAEAIRAYAREHRAARTRENPKAVLEAEREAARRSRAKRRRTKALAMLEVEATRERSPHARGWIDQPRPCHSDQGMISALIGAGPEL
jgi:hypothetical protein